MGLLRIDEVTGAVNDVNTIFYVPNPYVPGTLIIFRNGQQLKASLDNGYIESDPATGQFVMKVPPKAGLGHSCDPGDVLFAAYENALEFTGGGADGGVPLIRESLELRPGLESAKVVAPSVAAEEEEGVGVPVVSGGEKKPDLAGVTDLRPTIAGTSAE